MPSKENLTIKLDPFYERKEALVNRLMDLAAKIEQQEDDYLVQAALATRGLSAELEEILELARQLAPEREPAVYTPDPDANATEKLSAATAVIMPMLVEYANLDKRERELESELKDVASRKNALVQDGEGPLIEAWRDVGMQNIKLNGRNFYTHHDRRLVRNPESSPHEAAVALRRARLGALISEIPNSNSLKSWLKEREESGKPLPEGIAKHWKVFERVSVRGTITAK